MTELNREPFQYSLSESSLGNLALKWETPFLGPFPPRVSRKNTGLIHCVENGLVHEKGGPFPLPGIRRGRNKDTYAESSDFTSQEMQSTIQFRDPLSSQKHPPNFGPHYVPLVPFAFHRSLLSHSGSIPNLPGPFLSSHLKKPCWKLPHHSLRFLYHRMVWMMVVLMLLLSILR